MPDKYAVQRVVSVVQYGEQRGVVVVQDGEQRGGGGGVVVQDGEQRVVSVVQYGEQSVKGPSLCYCHHCLHLCSNHRA